MNEEPKGGSTMKILGICGTHKRKNKKSASEWFLGQALEAAREEGAKTDSIRLINYQIKPCLACNLCLCGKKCPLLEDPNDNAKEVFEKVSDADGIIFSSPVYAYQQPAIVYNFFHRMRPLHEYERANVTRLDINSVKNNPFSGKPIGNLAVGAAIGQEGTLYGILHVLKALSATPVACAGIALLEPEIKNLYSVDGKFCVENPKIKALFDQDFPSYEENECAISMARSVGSYIYKVCNSEVFQRIKYTIKH
jgi:multimeric flavodoxin WrbA